MTESLDTYDHYFNQMYNEKLRRNVTLADIESKCYR
jgi:hypothetical protein